MKIFFIPIIALFTFLLASVNLYAQAPQKINYQAVARDLSGVPLMNEPVTIVYDIRQSSPLGTIVYSETHNTTTNDFGLFNLAIGAGTPTLGTFPAINWSTGLYYLGVTVNGDVMPATQLLSVPYALHANTASTGTPGLDGNDNLSVVTVEPIGVNCANGGNKVEVGVDDNGDGTLQTLEIDYTYYVCDGLSGTANTSDTSATNELQTLSISNDTIFLSNGGFVQLPNIAGDADWLINGNDMSSMPIGNVGIGNPTPLFKLDVLSTDPVIGNFRGSSTTFSAIAISNTNPTSDVGVVLLGGSDTAIFGFTPVDKMLVLSNTTVGGHVAIDADSSVATSAEVIGNIAQSLLFNNSPSIYNEADTIYSYSSGGTIINANQGSFLTDSLYVLGNNSGNLNWILANDGSGQAIWKDPSLVTGGGLWSLNGTDISPNTLTDNVAIGVVNTTNAKFQVDNSAEDAVALFRSTNSTSGIVSGIETEIVSTSLNQYGIISKNNSSAAGAYKFGLSTTIGGAGSTNYGVYSNVSGATTNWAGFFAAGNIYVGDTLVINTGAGLGKVLTSDATGKASWQTPVVSTPLWTQGTGGVYPSTIADAVWIGTSNPIPGASLHIAKEGGTNVAFMETFGGSDSKFILSQANGTMVAPTKTTSGNTLGVIEFDGHQGGAASNYGRGADILVTSEADFSLSNASSLQIRTMNSASSFDARIAIDSDGEVGIGTTNPTAKLDILAPAGSADNIVKIGESGTTNKLKLSSGTTAYTFGGGDGAVIRHDITVNHASGNVGIGLGALLAPTAKLEVAGTFKLTDGTEGAGKILTSDATGNTTWKTNQVAFSAQKTTSQTLIINSYNEIPWNLETFDIGGNNFNPATGEFVAPVKGVYSFDVNIYYPSVSGRTAVILSVAGSNYLSTYGQVPSGQFTGELSTTVALNAGDVVKVRIYNQGTVYNVGGASGTSIFSGHLVFAE